MGCGIVFLDASVIVAILIEEDDADEIYAKLDTSKRGFFVSPLVRFEASVIVARHKHTATKRKPKPSSKDLERARAVVDNFLSLLGARDIAINSDVGRIAMEAAQTYGRFVGHKAQLNFGDCYAYACAKSHRLPLLYKGNDFAHTDLA